MGALIQQGTKTHSTKVSWQQSAQTFSMFVKDLVNLEAGGAVLRGRCPPWAQDACSDWSNYLWCSGSCLQGSKSGLTKLLSCDKGQFFVQFSFQCPDDGGVWLFGWLGLTEEKICVEESKIGLFSLCSWSSSLYQGMDVWKIWGALGRPREQLCTRLGFKFGMNWN